MHRLLILFIIAIFGLPLAAGCVSTGDHLSPLHQSTETVQQKTYRAQIIIKFRDKNTNPLQEGLTEGLSRDADAVISYLRPMSGGAHVFRVDRIDIRSSIGTIIRQLSKRNDIEYVEQDAIMQHR